MLRSAPKRLLASLCLCGVLLAAAPAGLWLDVPFVQQEKEGCGAASAAMVMQYWLKQQGTAPNADADARQIQRGLYSRPGHGIYASDLENYLQQHGFRTFVFNGTWDDLKQHLEKGRPLIAALKPAGGKTPLHYVVVVGLDSEPSSEPSSDQSSEPNIVLLNDPAQRKLLKQARSTFDKQWSATGRWLLLALPQSESQRQPSPQTESQAESKFR
jgi:ABC-type bacteriocin/lantibiotic exporter with double-glycine peptidase domain